MEQKSLTNFCSGFCFDPQTMDWQSIMLRLDYMGQCFQTHVERRAGWVDGWVLLGECCWVGVLWWVFLGGSSLVGVPLAFQKSVSLLQVLLQDGCFVPFVLNNFTFYDS